MSNFVKYRVWDKEQKRMIAVPSLHFGDDGSGRTITMWVKTPGMHDRLLVMGENADLLQFTGCQDCTGRDICEGDIVRWDYKGLDYIRTVQWRDERAMFLPNEMHTEVEIIGNIYEHTHLLKEPQ